MIGRVEKSPFLTEATSGGRNSVKDAFELGKLPCLNSIQFSE